MWFFKLIKWWPLGRISDFQRRQAKGEGGEDFSFAKDSISPQTDTGRFSTGGLWGDGRWIEMLYFYHVKEKIHFREEIEVTKEKYDPCS